VFDSVVRALNSGEYSILRSTRPPGVRGDGDGVLYTNLCDRIKINADHALCALVIHDPSAAKYSGVPGGVYSTSMCWPYVVVEVTEMPQRPIPEEFLASIGASLKGPLFLESVHLDPEESNTGVYSIKCAKSVSSQSDTDAAAFLEGLGKSVGDACHFLIKTYGIPVPNLRGAREVLAGSEAAHPAKNVYLEKNGSLAVKFRDTSGKWILWKEGVKGAGGLLSATMQVLKEVLIISISPRYTAPYVGMFVAAVAGLQGEEGSVDDDEFRALAGAFVQPLVAMQAKETGQEDTSRFQNLYQGGKVKKSLLWCFFLRATNALNVFFTVTQKKVG
jgi:hypothetical protein